MQLNNKLALSIDMWLFKIATLILIAIAVTLGYIYYFDSELWKRILNGYTSSMSEIGIEKPPAFKFAILFCVGIFVGIIILIYLYIVIVKCKKRQKEKNEKKEAKKNGKRRESQIEKMYAMFRSTLQKEDFFKEDEQQTTKKESIRSTKNIDPAISMEEPDAV